jgi:hypothetical protein
MNNIKLSKDVIGIIHKYLLPNKIYLKKIKEIYLEELLTNTSNLRCHFNLNWKMKGYGNIKYDYDRTYWIFIN